MKTVLLTGAAGAVGSETLQELLRRKEQYTVRAVEVRNPRTEKALLRFRDEVDIRWIDLTDRAAVDSCAQGIDAVIHLAAIIPPLADHQPALAERVNVQGTRNLVEAVQQHAPAAFLLYTSSISVYGDRVATPWIKVSDSLCPSEGDYYAITKIRAEQIVKESGLRWSIFRLTGIFKPTDNFDPLFFHMPLETSLEIATTRDTGFALVQALDCQPELQGRTFNLGGGARCRVVYRDFVDRSFARAGLAGLNFPAEAFAERNFHCGYYADADELEGLLHFQRDSLEDYLDWYEQSVPPLRRRMTGWLKPMIRRQLLQQSDPYRALQQNDRELIGRFFCDSTLTSVR
jgi:nucleoside-diphosphate-sugar epimerase